MRRMLGNVVFLIVVGTVVAVAMWVGDRLRAQEIVAPIRAEVSDESIATLQKDCPNVKRVQSAPNGKLRIWVRIDDQRCVIWTRTRLPLSVEVETYRAHKIAEEAAQANAAAPKVCPTCGHLLEDPK